LREKEEIVNKTKQLVDAARDDFVRRRMQHAFKNCKNNSFVMVRGVGKVNYCKIKSVFLEDGSIDKLFTCNSDDWSCSCKDFDCKNCEKKLVEQFAKTIASPSCCGQLFPKLSALLWVLNDGRLKESDLASDKIHGHEKNEQKKESSRGFINSVIFWLSPWRKS